MMWKYSVYIRKSQHGTQEKLEVLINGKIQQHFYDFTVSGDQLTVTKV